MEWKLNFAILSTENSNIVPKSMMLTSTPFIYCHKAARKTDNKKIKSMKFRMFIEQYNKSNWRYLLNLKKIFIRNTLCK